MEFHTVLILENEAFIAMDIEEIASSLGAKSVTTLDNRAAAITWLVAHSPDIAIVDPLLNDGVCSDVAALLSARGVPFVVYAGAEVVGKGSEAFATALWVGKPATPEALRQAMLEAGGGQSLR
ncbi:MULTISPECIES: response regulator [unclassified Rhizobium]|uniref:response regulator n=1 Tax=unclassified Rhizobium TaxID=2613769 RepID=UPI000DD6955E|nr:response regulator [Rhizobium sp. BG4]QRM47396.1 response regulator [Rhizobium sp. BG4]